jgi:hypothetical protein
MQCCAVFSFISSLFCIFYFPFLTSSFTTFSFAFLRSSCFISYLASLPYFIHNFIIFLKSPRMQFLYANTVNGIYFLAVRWRCISCNYGLQSPGDRRINMEQWWNYKLTEESQSARRIVCSNGTLSTTNLPYTAPGSNTGIRGGKPANSTTI